MQVHSHYGFRLVWSRRDGGLLAGLESVSWAGLRHAYGAAGDVPELIRALVSAEPEQRERALRSLYGNIFHQGSRYQATAYAVPFLARLAADPRVPGRPDILYLLAALAIGYDDAWLPVGVDIAGWRARVEQARLTDPAGALRELDAWVQAAGSDRERRVREMRRAVFDPAAALQSAQDELRAYDAVRAEVPGLLGLLEDGDPGVRAACCCLLAWFPEESPGSAAALRALLAGEAVPGVAATAIIAAGLLGGTGPGLHLHEHLRGPEPLLAWASAIALARAGSPGPEVLGVLAAASADPPPAGPGPQVPFLDGDLQGYAAQALAALGDHLPAHVIGDVLEGLARSQGTAVFPIASAALQLAFPGGRPDPLPPYGDLTALQQRVVRALAGLGPQTWRWVNFTQIMQAWNLPDARAECRVYAGLADKGDLDPDW
jgi:hypothetical protein